MAQKMEGGMQMVIFLELQNGKAENMQVSPLMNEKCGKGKRKNIA